MVGSMYRARVIDRKTGEYMLTGKESRSKKNALASAKTTARSHGLDSSQYRIDLTMRMAERLMDYRGKKKTQELPLGKFLSFTISGRTKL